MDVIHLSYPVNNQARLACVDQRENPGLEEIRGQQVCKVIAVYLVCEANPVNPAKQALQDA